MMNLAGSIFGRITVVAEAPRASRYCRRWLCQCECGSTTVVHQWNLTSGKTKSCGCLSSDWTRARNTKHGSAGTPTYTCWKQMRQRCTNPRVKRWADYGGRGIIICERWDSYENFLADMGERPAGTSIDRINNDGNYEPDNCRWATDAQQGANNRSCRPVTLQGVTHTQAEWCRILGLKPAMVSNRIHRQGWTPEDALTKPLLDVRRALRPPKS